MAKWGEKTEGMLDHRPLVREGGLRVLSLEDTPQASHELDAKQPAANQQRPQPKGQIA